ncbi:MAG: SIMPL domain-containing protein [Chloroflexi bacterium]|nr:SIMPL domain-containing protein [Chloroflexota bacterium]MBT4073567.1 SIMPL domain-containing protein [Chloroflexota bacterium]MBT4515072.1 SIMPL domain-containing protein [Chloroflexota bacterium]MBT5318983.1 SIMPL domain-containing protein [Chloroflexota bacterium]MBT6681130.1 SIMPL domain-containing protein [Chloroflexota bacterium]
MLEMIRNRKSVFIGGMVALTLVASVACSSDTEEDGGPSTVQPVGRVTNVPAGTIFAPSSEGIPIGLNDFARVAASQVSGNFQQVGIAVSGRGTVAVDPDIATLSLRIEARETTVSEARQVAAEAMARARTALTGAGVAEDDIITRNFSINPQSTYVERDSAIGKYGESVIIGYIVSNSVDVTIRDLDKVGEVIDTASEAAGDEVRINGISFGLDNPAQFGDTARDLAARDAHDKAELYAQILGVDLGPVVFLQETGGTSPAPSFAVSESFGGADQARSFAPTQISSGDVDVTASVSAVFAIVIPAAQ